MKRVFGITIAAVFVLGMWTTLVMAKAHVPTHKEQVCHGEEVLAVGMAAVGPHLAHGDCFIDKRTKRPPLFTGDACDAFDCTPEPE